MKEESSQGESTPLTSSLTQSLSSEPSLEKTESVPKEEIKEEAKSEDKPKEEPKVNDDPDTIFGLLEEDKLITNMGQLGTQENQNYYNHEPPKIKKNLGDLYNKVYQVNPNNIQTEYMSCLASFY